MHVFLFNNSLIIQEDKNKNLHENIRVIKESHAF